MALTHLQISNAKPASRAYKLSDTDGLYLFVMPNGSKLWRMNYRHLAKQKILHFGACPDVTIGMARARRDEARKLIADGLDPATEKRLGRIAERITADHTFRTIAEEWVAKSEREGRAEVTLDWTRFGGCSAWPIR